MAVRLLMEAALIVADPTGSLETPARGLNLDNRTSIAGRKLVDVVLGADKPGPVPASNAASPCR
jgi:hypothetical protein